MSISPSLLILSLTLFVFVLTVESVYHVYTYDNGQGRDEHCCLVRVKENFCLATPITRSLIQVNKQCHRFNRAQHRRRINAKKRTLKYFDKVKRRLEVESIQELNGNVLLALKTPLDQTILDKDLVCLASQNNHLNLDKCYVKTINTVDTKKETVDPPEEEEPENKEQKEEELNRFELSQPVRIQEGLGLGFRQSFQLNLKNIQPTERRERKCWTWYRRQIRRIRSQKSDKKSCIPLNDHREQCIHQLVYATSAKNHTANVFKAYARSLGSKLYCENRRSHYQLLGLHYRSKICIQPDHRIIIEHLFNDLANLSDEHRNQATLDLISRNKKFQAEFDDDCFDQSNLAEKKEPVNPRRKDSTKQNEK